MPRARCARSVLTLMLALSPVACDGGGEITAVSASPITTSSEGSGAGTEAGEEAPGPAAEAEVEAADIPSQDVADAAAAEAIDESNADEAFEALAAEIEADGE